MIALLIAAYFASWAKVAKKLFEPLLIGLLWIDPTVIARAVDISIIPRCKTSDVRFYQYRAMEIA